MIPIAAMKNSHAGRPGVVMGGGPSLEADLRQIPKDAILIAVNHHAFDYIVCADYTVFLDDITRFTVPQEDIRLLGGVLVSRQQESDVDLTGADWWHGTFSSHLATWLAGWMGCDPVLLAGMDCYQGERSEDADPRDNAYNTPLEEHLAGWREAFTKCPHPERIKALSGPLVKIFGLFP
jgi:hypothetical protein